MQALNDNWGACDVVLILHELHQRGYEQLRLHCGYGLAWRWRIYPKALMGKNALWEQHGDCAPFDCPHGAVTCPKNEVNHQNAADTLLNSAADLLELGKLPDKEYVQWFAQLVKQAQRGKYPVAFSEYFPSDDSWLFEPSQEKLSYPPFTPTDLDTASDEWVVSFGTQALDEYSKAELDILKDFDGIVPPLHEVAQVIRQCVRENKQFCTHIDLAIEQVMLYKQEDIVGRRDDGNRIHLKLKNGKDVELVDMLEIVAWSPTDSRLAHCRYYDGQTEPDMDSGFDEYYFAMAEKFYVNREHEKDVQHCLELLTSLHLDDLQGEVPLELVAQLYMTCDHILQKGSWEPCSPEYVAEYFRTKFFPKYIMPKNMKRDELLKLCHFYNGESECPQEFDGRNEGALWASEQTACDIMESPDFESSGNPRFDFDNMVAQLTAKWCPYQYRDILETYFRHSPTYKKRILDLL